MTATAETGRVDEDLRQGTLRQRVDEVNGLLERYHTVPYMYISPPSRRGRLLEIADTVGGSRLPIGETIAALALIDLWKADRFHLVRQCLCGKYFLARVRTQVSCSARCRHRLYEQTDEFKRKRREYSRNYYRRFLSPRAARGRDK